MRVGMVVDETTRRKTIWQQTSFCNSWRRSAATHVGDGFRRRLSAKMAGCQCADLNDVERAELDAHPIGSIFAPLPLDQLALRRSIARKQFESIKGTDWWTVRPAAVREAYNLRPPWKFYTNPDGRTRVYRMYGVAEYADGTCGVHVMAAHFLGINSILDGIRIEDAAETDDWTPNQIAIIDMCTCPEMFYDPCGWVVAVMSQQGGHDESDGEGAQD